MNTLDPIVMRRPNERLLADAGTALCLPSGHHWPGAAEADCSPDKPTL